MPGSVTGVEDSVEDKVPVFMGKTYLLLENWKSINKMSYCSDFYVCLWISDIVCYGDTTCTKSQEQIPQGRFCEI